MSADQSVPQVPPSHALVDALRAAVATVDADHPRGRLDDLVSLAPGEWASVVYDCRVNGRLGLVLRVWSITDSLVQLDDGALGLVRVPTDRLVSIIRIDGPAS